MAGAQGFEPHLPDPESGVLPLNYAPTARQKYAMRRQFRQHGGDKLRGGEAMQWPGRRFTNRPYEGEWRIAIINRVRRRLRWRGRGACRGGRGCRREERRGPFSNKCNFHSRRFPRHTDQRRNSNDPIVDTRWRSRRAGSDSPVQWHQRLIANPFLAVLGTILWFVCVRQTVETRTIRLFTPVAASLVLVIFLFEFHCMDCGRTGRLVSWRKHVCERVEVRRLSGRSLASWWPSVLTQTAVWLLGISIATLLVVLSRW